MATFELGISSADAVTFYPEFGYKDNTRKVEDSLRSASGKLFVYKWGEYDRIDFKAEFVPAADAAIVNSWWNTNTELLFFVTSSTATRVSSVMLRGEKPFQSYMKPYDNLMKGKILLEGY